MRARTEHGAQIRPNGPHAAQDTTATFSAAGPYQFLVTVTDTGGKYATSTTSLVTVAQTATSVNVMPSSASLNLSAQQTFAANVADPFGNAISGQRRFGDVARTPSRHRTTRGARLIAGAYLH